MGERQASCALGGFDEHAGGRSLGAQLVVEHDVEGPRDVGGGRLGQRSEGGGGRRCLLGSGRLSVA